MKRDQDKAAADMMLAAERMERAAERFEQSVASLSEWWDQVRTIMAPVKPTESNIPSPNDRHWQEWPGGFNPVGPQTQVWAKQRNGVIFKALASDVRWRHFRDPDGADVIAWMGAE
jgi:hypothetical protein